MSNRPAIPIEIKRQVLFEARHHCAVCCEPLPLELAHIIPWCETQDHSASNLIALCSNCHRRADTEKWGEKYLRLYKQKPCALEKRLIPPVSSAQKTLIDMIITTDPSQLTEDERLRLTCMLAAYLGIHIKQVEIVSVTLANSSRVRIALPVEAAKRLIAAFDSDDPSLKAFLDDIDVLSIQEASEDTPDAPIRRLKTQHMAVAEHLDILKQGAKTWNAWRKANPDLRPNLGETYLSDVDLRGADLHKADLRGADLRGADLSRVVLREANLREADLSHADLFEADLRYADLRHADFHQAKLLTTDLTGTNLSDANLRRADLLGVDLHYAILDNCNLTEVRCGSTIFADVDLSTAKGLETIDHIGPSTVGIDTLSRSQGKIPEVFLRGCGVSERLITFLPSLMEQTIQFYSCFISYSHQDKAFARRVHDTLQGKGIRCWLDEKQMLPGDDIYEEVDRGIRYWDKVLLCCSKHSLTSWWVDNEINSAFSKERHLMKDRAYKVLTLIPLDLDGYLFSDAFTSGKKEEIQSRLAANFQDWESNNTLFDEQIERVIHALQTKGAKEPPPESKLPPPLEPSGQGDSHPDS